MMPLKQASLAKAYNCLQCSVSFHAPAGAASSWNNTSSSPGWPAKRRKISPSQWRHYATVRSHKPFEFRDNLNWPCQQMPQSGNVYTSRPTPKPTPYEIFNIRPSGVYSKHQFYELVKMYHPDRHSHHVRCNPDHPLASLSPLERLERYRLVVRAHEILSDPVKRRAYDVSGAGWYDHHGTRERADVSTRSRARARPQPWAGSSSGADADSCFENATWEDWERWYARTAHPPHADGPQAYDGTFFNPNMFASLVIVVAILSGVYQATHVSRYSGTIEDRALAFTAQTQQFLTERRAGNSRYAHAGHMESGGSKSNGGGGKSNVVEERIKHFLERRDPYRSGLKDNEAESYRRIFGGDRRSSGVKKHKVDIAPD